MLLRISNYTIPKTWACNSKREERRCLVFLLQRRALYIHEREWVTNIKGVTKAIIKGVTKT
jgi:hypothetical protein